MTLIRQVTQDPMKVAHSLRGNFKDFLRENGVGKEVNDFITGHGQVTWVSTVRGINEEASGSH